MRKEGLNESLPPFSYRSIHVERNQVHSHTWCAVC